MGELAELAAREWGIRPDEFWRERPAFDRDDRGLTLPRLESLHEAYSRRRIREVRDLAIAVRAAGSDVDLFEAFAEPARPDPADDDDEPPGERWW